MPKGAKNPGPKVNSKLKTSLSPAELAALPDEELIDAVQRQTFRFFWEGSSLYPYCFNLSLTSLSLRPFIFSASFPENMINPSRLSPDPEELSSTDTPGKPPGSPDQKVRAFPLGQKTLLVGT